MEDFELTLYDRLKVIQETNRKYNLEENAYISFSGGKDSTILHYLIDLALPNNQIPRVFINTGIEYVEIVKFVKSLAQKDKRFIMIEPTHNVKEMLEKNGYPFKSKQHSHNVSIYQNSGMTKTVRKYLQLEKGNNVIVCPKSLKYQFTPDFNIKISDKCCYKMKKEPAKIYEQKANKFIAILGLRQNEGGKEQAIKVA